MEIPLGIPLWLRPPPTQLFLFLLEACLEYPSQAPGTGRVRPQ